MSGKDIVRLIFDDRKDVEAILGDPEAFDIHECMLKYGLSTKRFLYVDYKGEDDREIVDYILDYEFARNLELASQEELVELGAFEYELLPDKIKEANRIISKRGYGLFSYPTSGDFYALFIAKLENKTKLLQTDLLHDERIPSKERYVQYYS
ncbi:DUF6630 family protein [Paenibacillus chitinolyticus]